MQKIILATDFSQNAMHAARCAAGIAAACKSTLYILHAMDGATDPVIEPIALDTVLLEKYTREEFKRLRMVKQRITDEYPYLPVQLRLSRAMAADAIVTLAEKERAGLIVLGTHGSGWFKQLTIGSVAADVIGHAGTPVLAVPPEYEFEPPATLLLATHKFSEERSTLSSLIAIAEAFGASVDVASFIDTSETGAGEYLDTSWHLNHYLEFLQREFPSIGFSTHRLEGDDWLRSIDEHCRQQHIGMIALFNHPRSLIEKWCCRDHTRQTAFHSRIPTLILPPVLP